MLLVDGHSLAYRAWHAVPQTMTSRWGERTGVTHGFLMSLLSLVSGRAPDGVVVCFDCGRDRWRSELFPGYKAGRPDAPDGMAPQLARLREVLSAAGLPSVRMPEVEADDLIAALASCAVSGGWKVEVLSSDRDLVQLVSPEVSQLMPAGRGAVDVVTPDVVVDRYGVTPDRYRMLAALRGDRSDGIPGVPGVGPVTAARLASLAGAPSGLRGAVDGFRPARHAAAVEEHWDVVVRNFQLVGLRPEVVSVPEVRSVIGPWFPPDPARAASLLEGIGLSRAAGMLSGEMVRRRSSGQV